MSHTIEPVATNEFPIMRSPSFRASYIHQNIAFTDSDLTNEDEEGNALDLAYQQDEEDANSTEFLPTNSNTATTTTFTGSRRERSPFFRPSAPGILLTRQDSVKLALPSPRSSSSSSDNVIMSIVFGLVNVCVSIPCLYGYAGIIYRDPMYHPYLPDLAKLVILSSAVHQLVFSFKSSLPFAIAQVQDAGLIFLSSMATTIVKNTDSKEEAIATCVIYLSLATASLGFCVWIVGRFKFANIVTLIPMPVVSGYLAFIGVFCGFAGIGLSCSKDISTGRDLDQLDFDTDAIFVFPAIISGAAMCLVSRYSTKWYALPGTIVLIPMLFFAVLLWTRTSLAQARTDGWVAPLTESESILHVFSLFDFKQVKWSVLPKLITTWLSMTFLVVFASALDIVAVEMDLAGAELDIDKELETVGISNLISGLCGGLTGSYIFSQTIFTRRTGTRRRVIGMLLAITELLLFCAPFSLMSYIPRFFFAATLIFIALDLMLEWLVTVGFRVSTREYFLVLLTFFAITFTEDLVLGILIGTAGAVVNFISLYSRVDPIIPTTKSSNVLREFEARKVLAALAPTRIISARISGFLFFGSSTLLLRRVREFLHQEPPPITPLTRQALTSPPRTLLDAARRLSSVNIEGLLVPSPVQQQSNYGTVTVDTASPLQPFLVPPSPRSMSRQPRRYLVLDFEQCSGLDATAVSTGLIRIRMLTQTHNLGVVFSAVSPAFSKIMRANHVIGPDSGIIVADNLNDGLDFCETELLEEAKFEANRLFVTREMRLNEPPLVHPGLWNNNAMDAEEKRIAVASARDSFAKLIGAFFGWQGAPSMSHSETIELCSNFEILFLKNGEIVFDEGESADRLFVILSGEVVLYKVTESWRLASFSGRAHLARTNPGLIFGKERQAMQRARYGSMFGDLNFTLQQKRQFGAVAERDCCVFVLSRERMSKIEKDHPRLAVGLLKVVGRSLGMTLVNMHSFQDVVDV